MSDVEIVNLGRNDTIDRQLVADDHPLTVTQMRAITRIDLIYNGQTISSIDHPAAFDWTTREDEAVLIMELGNIGIPAGIDLAADLVVYDVDHPNGLSFGVIPLRVL